MHDVTIKPGDLAEELNVTTATLGRWRRTKPEYRGPKWLGVGRGIRYRRADVDAWLKQRECRALK